MTCCSCHRRTVAERSYTLDEAAKLKSVSKDYLRRAIKTVSSNPLRAKLVGRGYHIGAADLERWWDGLENA